MTGFPTAGQVLYEVRGTTQDARLADTIETYLRVTHIPEVLATGCFAGAYVARLDPFTFRTTYVAHDQASLERYFAEHTARLRGAFLRRFPTGVTLVREEWLVAERFGAEWIARITAILAGAFSFAFGPPNLLSSEASPASSPQAATLPQATSAVSGVWETVRVNRTKLPMTDQVVGTDGFTHAVRLHEMTIRLRPNNRFQAALRYRRAILTKGERIETAPLQTDTWLGTYTMEGPRMRFIPERRAGQQVQPFDGVREGRRITVEFDYHIVTRKRYVLEMDRNDQLM